MECILKCLKEILTNETFISYLEIFIETIFLFFVLKEFKMTRKSFEWQEEADERYKLESIIKELRIRYYIVVDDNEFTKKMFRTAENIIGYKKEEEENKLIELSSGRDGTFDKMIEYYNLQENEKKFLRKICDNYVFNNEGVVFERLIRDEWNKLDNKDIITYMNGFFNIRLPKQICEVFKIDYKMIDKLYLKIVFSQIYDQKKTN